MNADKPRYTVSENPFGYEADVGTARLRYAVTDNKPDKVRVYKVIERENVLVPNDGGEGRRTTYTKDGKVPFRHVAYCYTKEDAEDLAEAMNPVETKQ